MRLLALTWGERRGDRGGERELRRPGLRPPLSALAAACGTHRPRPVHAGHHEGCGVGGGLTHTVLLRAEQAVVDVVPPSSHRDLVEQTRLLVVILLQHLLRNLGLHKQLAAEVCRRLICCCSGHVVASGRHVALTAAQRVRKDSRAGSNERMKGGPTELK
jgi:hypothetical protein